MKRGSTASPGTGLPPVIDIEVIGQDNSLSLSSDELSELRHARELLSSPSAAIRFTNVIGAPIEKGFRLLPATASKVVHYATRAALTRALRVAMHSLDGRRGNRTPENGLHKVLVGTSGALGGAFGLGALVVELPVSTTLILRSIAQIASSQGQDLRSIQTRLACLEVFALGGDTTSDNAAETSYWAIRAGLARLVSEAAGSVAGHSTLFEVTPAAVRLITALAARFGVIVSEQVAAKAVPIVGAVAGAAINIAFMSHFQRMAEGHFIVKRLEQAHGTDVVQLAYQSLATARAD